MYSVLLLSLQNSIKSPLFDVRLAEFRSRDRLWSTPHLGLLTVGAMLGKHFQVDYMDLNYEPISNYAYDFVFLSPSTSQVNDAYQYAITFKNHNCKIVMGGPHVSMLPDEALKYADSVFIGEAEEIIDGFISDIFQNKIKPVYESSNKPELQNSPIPLYHLAKKYPYKSIPVQLSRGCPHQCSFCLSSTIYGKSIRRKSIAQARVELETIHKIWEKPFIFFTDDNFLIDEGYSAEVLKIIKNFGLEWYAFTDISVYRRDFFLAKLTESGCRKLLIGFESLNTENLIQLNKSGFKKSKRKVYKTAIDTIQRCKIGVIGSFVLGLEEDCAETFDDLYRFILDTCIYGTNITIATPFPGTEFYKKLKENGRILSSNWTDYDGFSLLYDLPHIHQDVFMNQYNELIRKINSKDRMKRVFDYFKKVQAVK